MNRAIFGPRNEPSPRKPGRNISFPLGFLCCSCALFFQDLPRRICTVLLRVLFWCALVGVHSQTEFVGLFFCGHREGAAGTLTREKSF